MTMIDEYYVASYVVRILDFKSNMVPWLGHWTLNCG